MLSGVTHETRVLCSKLCSAGGINYASLQCKRFFFKARDRNIGIRRNIDLGKVGREGVGKNGPPPPPLPLPRTHFCLSPSLFRVWIQDGARLIKALARDLAKIRLHCRLVLRSNYAGLKWHFHPTRHRLVPIINIPSLSILKEMLANNYSVRHFMSKCQ